MRGLLALLLAAAALVTEAQAPHNYTAYDFIADTVAQCVEDAECGSDTECAAVEDRCIREINPGGNPQ